MINVSVVYLVMNQGLMESAWTDPDRAIEAKMELKGAATITVRPLDSDQPTPEYEAALADLRARLAARRRSLRG